MRKNKTQCERIVDYINDFGSISTLEAFNDLGCTRLASRIHDLKQQGFVVDSKFETAKNRYGETVMYKRYYIKRENNENGRMDKLTPKDTRLGMV